ncbi:MAG: leucine--tRNA ligase [Phycisphaerae bacterium]|nr:leucine--tRNA ligase [Phycisphaerae bacterium]
MTSHESKPASAPPHRYTARYANELEVRWQGEWESRGTSRVRNPGDPDFDPTRPKFYALDMFPYPSGAGLHVGHPEGYIATDIVSRFKRMRGYNVLHPMGYDAFGLPAEQYAIQTGVHPAITTRQAIDNFRRQLKRFGFSYDWSREVSTIDREYYRWTQWIFLTLYESWYNPWRRRAEPVAELVKRLARGEYVINLFGELVADAAGIAATPIGGEPVGRRRWHDLSEDERRDFIDSKRLAYLGESVVNWCPKLGTVLANDEVIDGRSERGGHPVLRKPLKQWMFRITEYSQRLLEDLDKVDWPQSTRTMQREWIGRSEGAEIDFDLVGAPHAAGPSIRVFTTRPDTLFGATFMVVAPEHPLVDALLADPGPKTDEQALRAYVAAARNRGEVERMADSQAKTGVPTGLLAANPATGWRIPIWVADYVLMGYGHGAIMGVPAHDQRDFDFAARFGLPIIDVIYPRARLAMKYFADQARPEDRVGERWRDQMADFVGLVTSLNAEPGAFGPLLETIRGRRAPAGGESGGAERRGTIRSTWLDAIDDMGIDRLETLEARLREGGLARADGSAYEGPGYAVNSPRPGTNSGVDVNGLPASQAKVQVTDWLTLKGAGRARVNYRLRDWTFSRQRYWGEPIPIVFDMQGRHYPVTKLPVVLPELDDYHPIESDDPQPLLSKAWSWVSSTAAEAGIPPGLLPPETPVRRETNTMPGSAGSSWYFLRYCDPSNPRRFVDPAAEAYWMAGGVDLYIGGAEHAVGHLLYARFWHKVLSDLGHVSSPEPFRKLFHQGLITSFAYQRPDKTLVPVDHVEPAPPEVTSATGKLYVERGTGTPLNAVVAKMSKSLKNVVNPDDVIAEYGADTFRLYEMYMGPLEMSKPWNPRDISGCFRFLQRAWRLAVDEDSGALTLAPTADERLERLLHRLTVKVETDIERLAFNTAIAAMMEFVNAATPPGAAAGAGVLTREQAQRFALLLAPFVPHLAEELWQRLGHTASIAHADWPDHDPALLRDDTVEIPVQVQGKVRGRITVPAGAPSDAVQAAALADERVRQFIADRPIKKVIVVPGKMVNVVV